MVSEAITMCLSTYQKTPANFPVKSLLKLLLKFSVDWDFPDGPVVKTLLPLQGARVQSLDRELRSHKPHGMAKKKKGKKKKFCVQYIYFSPSKVDTVWKSK